MMAVKRSKILQTYLREQDLKMWNWVFWFAVQVPNRNGLRRGNAELSTWLENCANGYFS